MTGASVAEIPVSHHERQFGLSKYGFDRIFKVFSDVFAINLLIRFSSTPLKGFVLCGIPFFLLSLFLLLLAFLAAGLGWTEGKAIFFTLGSVISLSGGLILLALGVLGELAISLTDLSHTGLISATVKRGVFSASEREATHE